MLEETVVVATRPSPSAAFRWPRGAQIRAWHRGGECIATRALRNLDLADWLMLWHDDDRRTVDLEVLLPSPADPLSHDALDWLAWRIRYDFIFEGYRVRLVPQTPRSRPRTRRVLAWRLSIWTP